MEEVDFESCLLPGTVVLYVVSSTGDGDPPDNCAKFYSEIRVCTLPHPHPLCPRLPGDNRVCTQPREPATSE
jgi:hypothetical protein